MATKKKKNTTRSDSAQVAGFRFSLADLIQSFRERWLIGLLVGTIATALIIKFVPTPIPVYRTDASLLFESRHDRVLNMPDIVDTSVQNAEELNTHMEQLRSQTFLEYVVSSFTKEDAKKIQDAYRDSDNRNANVPAVASIIAQDYSVYARRGTMIIGIAVTDRSPDNAALIANRIANRYIEFNNDRAATGTNSAIVFLRQQLEDVRGQVKSAESALEAYRAKYNIAALGQSQNVILQKLSSVGNELVKTQMDEVELEAIIKKIDQVGNSYKDLLELPQILSYGQTANLASHLDSLKSDRALLEQKYLRMHPKMIENDLETKETNRQLDDNIRLAVANLRTRYNLAKQYEQSLKAALEDSQNKAHELDKVSVDYTLLQQEAETKRATYTRINDRLNEANVTSQLENVNIKIFDPAYIPSTPTNSGFLRVVVGAVGLGLFLFAAVPIGIGLLDTRVKTVDQVEGTLGETLLGAIKQIKDLEAEERPHAFRLHKDSALEEAYRGVYSEMDIRSELPFPKSLVITSTMPGDGKSLTSSNLAAVFAAHGRRTLLVDCDLRRPTLHVLFKVDGAEGWTQWALSPLPADQKKLPTAFTISDNFDLLPAGKMIADNPTETLERLVTSGLLDQLKARYDLVILDTPPVAVFPDALLLCRRSDELICVCRFHAVRVGSLRRVMKRIRETGISVAGLVLNRMPESKLHRYGYEGYGSYKKDYYKAYGQAAGDR